MKLSLTLALGLVTLAAATPVINDVDAADNNNPKPTFPAWPHWPQFGNSTTTSVPKTTSKTTSKTTAKTTAKTTSNTLVTNVFGHLLTLTNNTNVSLAQSLLAALQI
ncbi:hypothetical protein HF325_005612 [Metschnikowia pulcherrima]|uniref:Uncharacterized protein n=1 Tax=Metschnikowia pulcherrima TaxID=27326 RepID=A0A8H7GMD1_9ASCO|nr:hypothetical protein HF325_005612 [Metschnikowia pulcherrima]